MRNRRPLYAYTLLAVLASGALVPMTAFAQQDSSTQPAQTQSQDAGPAGSIAVPENQDLSESRELAQIRSLATVSLEEAIAAAQKATGLSDAVTKAELGNDNGFLVWDIAIGDQEVKVDAGNGEVLQVQQADAEEEVDDSKEGSQHEEEDGGDEGSEEEGEGSSEEQD